MGERRILQMVLVGKRDGKVYLEDLGVDWKLILQWIFRE